LQAEGHRVISVRIPGDTLDSVLVMFHYPLEWKTFLTPGATDAAQVSAEVLRQIAGAPEAPALQWQTFSPATLLEHDLGIVEARYIIPFRGSSDGILWTPRNGATRHAVTCNGLVLAHGPYEACKAYVAARDASMRERGVVCPCCEGRGDAPDWGDMGQRCGACLGTGRVTAARLADLVRNQRMTP
jgi:hypothetical protein